jgi:hypothetical protein
MDFGRSETTHPPDDYLPAIFVPLEGRTWADTQLLPDRSGDRYLTLRSDTGVRDRHKPQYRGTAPLSTV